MAARSHRRPSGACTTAGANKQMAAELALGLARKDDAGHRPPRVPRVLRALYWSDPRSSRPAGSRAFARRRRGAATRGHARVIQEVGNLALHDRTSSQEEALPGLGPLR